MLLLNLIIIIIHLIHYKAIAVKVYHTYDCTISTEQHTVTLFFSPYLCLYHMLLLGEVVGVLTHLYVYVRVSSCQACIKYILNDGTYGHRKQPTRLLLKARSP